jgi:inner membrane protein
LRGTTHATIGALGAVELGLTTHVSAIPFIAGIVLSTFAGKIVDIDEPNSTISREISPPVGFLRLAFFAVAACLIYYIHFYAKWDHTVELIAYGVCGLLGCFSMIGGAGNFRRIGITLVCLTISFFAWKMHYPTAYIVPGIALAGCAWLPHRWAVHSPVAALGWSVMVYFMLLPFPNTMYYTKAAALGFVLHLLADSLTDHGVMWGWPLTKKKISLHLMKTGSPTGKLVESLVIAAMLIFIDYRHFGILGHVPVIGQLYHFL